MDKQEKIEKLRKFTQDPDWQLVVEMFDSHLNPLKDVMSINTERTNDEIASDVRGRQISITSLTSFLKNTGMINEKITSNKTTFR